MDYQKRFILALFLLLAILSLGSLGYFLIENISILDAIYMTLITISTVGFREVTNLSVLGKLFTMVLIIAGVGVLFYTLTTTLEFIIEGHLKGVLEKRRKEKHMKRLKNHFIVCGFGKVGKQVVSELKKYNFPFIVVENNPKKVENSISNGNLTIEGDASLENVLIDAGIERSKGLVSAVDTDADNVFIVLTARSINEKLFIVSRADSFKAIKKLEKAGANRVISPAIIGGRRMATMLFK
ncbi:MAG: potassium channel family protein, partial [Actinomycetia bacterium]|nr:potassium channel family protein [Actinomycetes bacterium]